MFRYVGDIVDRERARGLGASALLAMWGGITPPDDLRPELDQLRTAVTGLDADVETLDGVLERAEALLRAGQRTEARSLLNRARQLVTQSRASLRDIRARVNTLAGRFGIRKLSLLAPARQALERATQIIDRFDARQQEIAQALAAGKYAGLRRSSVLLRWSAPDRAYPGLPIVVSGAVVRAGSHPGEPERLVLSLDNRVLARISAQGEFRTILTVPNDSAPGPHEFVLSARVPGLTDEVTETRTLELVQYPLRLEVLARRIAWIPGRVAVSGRVASPSGPVDHATVSASFGGVTTTGKTGPGGRFELAVSPRAGLGFAGQQVLRLAVEPAEPWNAPAGSEVTVLVVNPLNAGAVAAVALLPVMATYAQARRRRTREVASRPFIPNEPVGLPRSEDGDLSVGGPATGLTERLLAEYRDAVRQVEQTTGVRLSPHLTLREFARAVSLRLHAPTFGHMTTLAELALYSTGPMTDETLQQMIRLRRELSTHERDHGA